MISRDNNKRRWKIDLRLGGRSGKRYRKSFATKAEALRWEAWMKSQHAQNPEWEPPKKDQRRLSELIEEWYQLHGQHLKDAENRLGRLEFTCQGLGNPIASELTGASFTHYRAARSETVTANTLNHELVYLRAVFNELIRLGHWKGENPLKNVRKLQVDEHELAWLSTDEVSLLLNHLAERRRRDALLATKVCLATGARWSEAEKLTAEQLQPHRITYHRTKNGRSRSVPISPELYEEIRTTSSGRLFGNCYDAFTNALEASGIQLPKGQRTHVLRHTFASHFVMKGGNLLTLQKILGHQSIQMTMRYAHLAPDHLNDAVRLNPLIEL
ncbi:tyrosine-type recombinase/integrase [Marinobacterium sp. AK62]|uniref:Tyrosine-type recombinase/integrase n=1 Tax=Marinobacterium alkalitolerans TaxID=1542925 RepID=A0ABS3ZDQ6_9GAMM|nr:tyrosine-type recombinase/integrase [Marinobacterium alkalitolerans]MBP0049836.1 tyrosine-type recombinase/integrase [Marinobacterium alkalitolerans]